MNIDRELHPDRVALIIRVLHLRLGERGLFDHAPHHGLAAAIKQPVHGELHEFGRDERLALVLHGEVGVPPVALDAQPHELLPLDVHPVVGEVAALLAELEDADLVLVLAGGAVLLLDLPLDGQAMTVPARHVVGVLAQHLLRADDHVFQDLVEAGADVDVAVGIGWPIMQHERGPALGAFTLALIELGFLPALDQLRFALGQARLHRKFGFWQKQRFRPIALAVDRFGGRWLDGRSRRGGHRGLARGGRFLGHRLRCPAKRSDLPRGVATPAPMIQLSLSAAPGPSGIHQHDGARDDDDAYCCDGHTCGQGFRELCDHDTLPASLRMDGPLELPSPRDRPPKNATVVVIHGALPAIAIRACLRETPETRL